MNPMLKCFYISNENYQEESLSNSIASLKIEDSIVSHDNLNPRDRKTKSDNFSITIPEGLSEIPKNFNSNDDVNTPHQYNNDKLGSKKTTYEYGDNSSIIVDEEFDFNTQQVSHRVTTYLNKDYKTTKSLSETFEQFNGKSFIRALREIDYSSNGLVKEYNMSVCNASPNSGVIEEKLGYIVDPMTTIADRLGYDAEGGEKR